MKAACCGQEIEIQTDPKNCEYKVISGAVQKTVTYDEVEAETTLLPDPGGKIRQFQFPHRQRDLLHFDSDLSASCRTHRG